MTDQVAEIDPFAPGALDQETELAALTHALEFASGFSLLFVVCNQAPKRRQLMGNLRQRLPKFTVQEIHFNQPVSHFLDTLRERLDFPLPDTVLVSGLEYSLPSLAEAATTSFVANLNASRNSFPQVLPRPIVFWVPEYVLTAIAQGAPDFFSIRSGVYSFVATPDERAEFANFLSADEHWQALSLPMQEKQDRIAAIKMLLAEYEALPTSRHNYQAELRLLDRLGTLLYAQGNYSEALLQFQRAIRLAEEIDDRSAVASLLQRIGLLHTQREELADALRCFEQALRIMSELGHLPSVASVLHNIGNINYLQGEYPEALRHYKQSLEINNKLGNQESIANSLHQLGMLNQAMGDYAEAIRHYEQSLEMATKLGNRVGIASSLHQLGRLYQARGEYSEAFRRYEQSLQIALELGDQAQIAKSLGQAGRLFMETKHLEKAFDLLLKALVIFLQLQSPDARIAINDLNELRAKWGEQAFDSAWQTAMGKEVPEWLKISTPPAQYNK